MAAAVQEKYTIRLSHVSEHVEIEFEENEEASPSPTKRPPSSSQRKKKNVFLRVSESSPALLQAQQYKEQQPTSTAITGHVVKYALAGALVKHDILESIHVLSKPKPIRVYKKLNFLSRLQQTMAIDSNYPMNLVLIRRSNIIKPTPKPIVLDEINSPVSLSPSRKPKTRKRRKQQKNTSPTTMSTPPKQQQEPKEAIICILSSSESETDNELVGDAPFPPTRKPILLISPQENGGQPTEQTANNNTALVSTSTWIAQPDPPPIFQKNDLVSTPVGPGRVLDSRIDRLVEDKEVNDCLIHPILTYKIQLAFGILYVPSNQVSYLSTSKHAHQHVLCRYGICLTQADMVRLWPGVYLNDLLVNFYLKHLQQQQVHDDEAVVKQNNSVFCFSSYFYTMLAMASTPASNTKKKRQKRNDNSNNTTTPLVNEKQQKRQVLWKSLERSTQNVDLLSMDYIMIPINYDLHWSFVMVCHPGAVVVDAAVRKEDKGNDMVVSEQEPLLLPPTSTTPNTTIQLTKKLPPRSKPKRDDIVVVGTTDDVRVAALAAPPPPAAATTTAQPARKDDALANTMDSSASQTTKRKVQPEKTPQKQPCILHLDSGRHFGLHRSATIFKHVRNYLMACHEANCRDADGVDAADNDVKIEFNGTTMPGLSPPVPVQDNLSDCGLYMLEMMERLLRQPLEIKEGFWEKKGNVSPFGKKWFAKDSIEQKRQEMRSLIHNLSHEPN